MPRPLLIYVLLLQDVVLKSKTGEPVTLQQVFKELKLSAYDLNVDSLDVHVSNVESCNC